MDVIAFPVVRFIAEWAALKVTDGVTNELISDVIGALVKTNKEVLAKLDQVDQKLDDLRRGPFNTGMIYLEEVSAADNPSKHLERALEKFYDALGIEAREIERVAWIEWHIANCYLLLNRARMARQHYKKCFDTAQSAINTAQETYELELKLLKERELNTERTLTKIFDHAYVFVYVVPIVVALLGLMALPVAQNLGCILLIVALVATFVLGSIFSRQKPKAADQRVSPAMNSLVRSSSEVLLLPPFQEATVVDPPTNF